MHGGPTSESLKGWRNVKIRRVLLVEMIFAGTSSERSFSGDPCKCGYSAERGNGDSDDEIDKNDD